MVVFTDTVFILMIIRQTTAVVLSLNGSKSYIEKNKDFVLTCTTDTLPAFTLASFMKDGASMINITYYKDSGDCYGSGNGVPTGFCTNTKICGCNALKYNWTFNGDIQKDKISFSCSMTFGNPEEIKMSTLLVSKASPPTSGPSITQYPVGPIFKEGNITLTCEIPAGVPLAVISWKCAGSSPVLVTPASSDKVTSSVQLTVNSAENGKTCICEATHLLWDVKQIAEQTIVVYYQPSEPLELSVFPSGIISSGTALNSTCFLKGGNPLVTLTLSCNGQFGSKFNTSTTAFSTLMFTADDSYNGKYCVCIATQPVGGFNKTESQKIEVQYAPFEQPSITQFPSNVSTTGSSITLKCEVSGGNPLANLSWDCGTIVTNNTANNTASYSVSFVVNKTDNGRKCTCSATHPVTGYRPTVQHTIVVYYPPETTLAVSQFPPGPIDTGDEVRLTCNVTGGNPLAKLSWDCGSDMKNNTSGNTSSYSVLFHVNSTSNGRQCNCSATHPILDYRPMKHHVLNVYYPPSIPSLIVNSDLPLFEGNETDITCAVTDDGNPQSYTKWTWNRTNVHTSIQNTLEIGPMKKSDNGAVVTCRIENEYSIRKRIDLQVNESLNVEYYPSVLVEKETITVIEGQTVNVKCITFGNPLPEAEWFKMEEPNSIDKGGQELNLTILEINRHEKGQYQCKAVSHSERYGILISSAYIDLIVNYPPNVSIDYTLNNENDGQAIYECNASGNPNTYTYTGWTQTYNGIVIRGSEKLKNFTQDNNKKLILSKLSYQDSGNYTCFVNNGIPDRHDELQQFSKKQLDIEGSPELLDSLPPDDTFSTERGGHIAINLRFLTFPDITDAFWYRNTSKLPFNTKLPDGIVANIEKNIIVTKFHGVVVNVSSYAYHAHLNISKLEEHMEGAYILVLRNDFKDKNVTVFVVISSKPDDPTDLNITRKTSMGMTISWKRGYSGGHNQSFNLSVFDSTGIRFTQMINDNYTATTQIYTISDLYPSTKYVLHLYSQNKIGKSNVITINTTTEAAAAGLDSTKQEFPVGAVVGVLTGVLAAVLVVIVVIYMKRRCSILRTDQGSTSRKKITAIEKEDEEENGLKDNILYESAGQDFGSHGGSSGAEYAVVTKNKDKFKLSEENNIQETTLYSVVTKNTKAEQRDPVYTNAVNPKKIKKQTKVKKNESSEEVYEHMSGDVENKHSLFRERKENKDGLVYADLVFNPSPNGPRFIHGEDDRTIYADVDTTQKIDPLPESDEEETTKDEQFKVTDK